MGSDKTFQTIPMLRASLIAIGPGRTLNLMTCPCFWINVENMKVHGHCWRICHECEYCGIHISGGTKDKQEEVGYLLKMHLDEMDWYGEWEVRYE